MPRFIFTASIPPDAEAPVFYAAGAINEKNHMPLYVWTIGSQDTFQWTDDDGNVVEPPWPATES